MRRNCDHSSAPALSSISAHEGGVWFAGLDREEAAVVEELEGDGLAWSLVEGQVGEFVSDGELDAVEFVGAGARDEGAVGVNFELGGGGLGEGFGADLGALGLGCRFDEGALDEGEKRFGNDQAVAPDEATKLEAHEGRTRSVRQRDVLTERADGTRIGVWLTGWIAPVTRDAS